MHRDSSVLRPSGVHVQRVANKTEVSRLVGAGAPPPADSGNLAIWRRRRGILRVPVRGITAVELLE